MKERLESTPSIQKKTHLITLNDPLFVNDTVENKRLLQLLQKYQNESIFTPHTTYAVDAERLKINCYILDTPRQKQRQGKRFIVFKKNVLEPSSYGFVYDGILRLAIRYRFILGTNPKRFKEHCIYIEFHPEDPNPLHYAMLLCDDAPQVFKGSIPFQYIEGFKPQFPLTHKQIRKYEHQLVELLLLELQKNHQKNVPPIEKWTCLSIKTSEQKAMVVKELRIPFDSRRERSLIRSKREHRFLEMIPQFHVKPLVYLPTDGSAFLTMNKMPGVALTPINQPEYELIPFLEPDGPLKHNTVYFTYDEQPSDSPENTAFIKYTLKVPYKNPVFIKMNGFNPKAAPNREIKESDIIINDTISLAELNKIYPHNQKLLLPLTDSTIIDFEEEILTILEKREHIPGGIRMDLKDYVQLFYQSQVDYKEQLPKNGLLHRDIKPEHFLITYDPQKGFSVKFIDVGGC